MALLETSADDRDTKKTKTTTKIDPSRYVADRRDDLKGSTAAKPIALHNRFNDLQSDDGDDETTCDDESDDDRERKDSKTGEQNGTSIETKSKGPGRRRR